MGHQMVSNYYPVVQNRTEDKYQEELLNSEKAIVCLYETKTNDNSNGRINNHLNRLEEAKRMTKAYTGPAEKTQKDSKDEGEDKGKDKNEAENNHIGTIIAGVHHWQNFWSCWSICWRIKPSSKRLPKGTPPCTFPSPWSLISCDWTKSHTKVRHPHPSSYNIVFGS